VRKAGLIFSSFLAFLICGCAARKQFVGNRPFDFQKDTLTYANELIWVYHFDTAGKWVHEPRQPDPTYVMHCFVMGRTARQFFQHATFEPGLPVADDTTYRELIQRVVSIGPTRVVPARDHVVIPGYPDLRTFSRAHEQLLKDECGGGSQSYFQRGNWRIVFPFFRSQQACTARQMTEALRENRPPIIHLGGLPDLVLNHCIVVFAAEENEKEIRFQSYDPNEPDAPVLLTFNRADRTFYFPQTDYFRGGHLNVFEVYRNWMY
jgi:hypothetical protein